MRAPAGGADSPPDARALTAGLPAQFDRSAAAWNRGDLNAFVSDYAPDSGTTFVSQGHVQHGFTWIRDHYAPPFEPGDRAFHSLSG